MTITHHVGTVAVPPRSQAQINIRLVEGEVELSQDYQIITVRPENVFTLIGAMLCMIGMENVCFYEAEGPFDPEIAAMMQARPDIDWKAVIEETNRLDLSDDREDGPEKTPPKDRTAAERQRRRRAKQRDSRDSRDSDRDTVTAERDAQAPLNLRPAE